MKAALDVKVVNNGSGLISRFLKVMRARHQNLTEFLENSEY